MMSLIVNCVGVVLILTIVWWFWLAGRKGGAEHYSDTMEILVKDGVYDPDRIEVSSGQKVTLYFRREDSSPCAEYVMFSDLDISKQLAVGQVTELQLPALDKGEYPFTCQMKMYRGTLIAD